MEMTMSTTYSVIGTPRYNGRCTRCSREARYFEAVLLRAPDGKFAVAHASCVGVRTKSKIGGGRVIVSGPDTITTEE
jgi:hypothetical protein